MQEEDSLEPPAPPQTADEDLRGLDIFLHPQIQPFAQIWQAGSLCENYRVTSALDGMAPLLCPPSPSSTRDSFHFRPWWKGGLWNNSAAIEHLQNALFADFFHDLQ